jgi:HlyD family secretion protein
VTIGHESRAKMKWEGDSEMGRRSILAAVLCTVIAASMASGGLPSRATNPLQASGVIAAEEVRVASELQGYATQVLVQPGDPIQEGQTLVVLSNASVESSVQQARAAVDAARADLEVAQARPRNEAIAAKQAQVAMAQADRNRAFAAQQAALEARNEPQALRLRFLEAEAQVALAAANVELAEAQQAQALHEADQAEWNSTERQILEFEAEAKRTALEATRADLRAAQTALQHLQQIENNPLSYMAKARKAQGDLRIAEAAVLVVQAELRDLLAGPSAPDAAMAEAGLALAEAQLSLAKVQSERLTIRSPLAGTVLMRVVGLGETVLPGVTLLTVADLSQVVLTVYVAQTSLSQVSLGQTADVSVDSYPLRRFEGRVVHVSDRAEYTPRNVATREERVNTVYPVEILLPNPEGLLKPGMPADAVFRP